MPERRLSIPGPAPYRDAMIRAFLAGTKTQVRLPIDLPPTFGSAVHRLEERWRADEEGRYWRETKRPGFREWIGGEAYRCPFVAPGDALWLPETWAETFDAHGGSCIAYRADGAARVAIADCCGDGDWCELSAEMTTLDPAESIRWRPWNQMPRRWCRLTRRVVDVRVERVQKITTDSVKAEGHRWPHEELIPVFRRFWDARYAGTPFAWGENPPVWVATLAE